MVENFKPPPKKNIVLATLVTSFLLLENSPDKSLNLGFYSRVMLDRDSQVKRDSQGFLEKKVIVVLLVPQELDYQGLLDLVDLLEIKE